MARMSNNPDTFERQKLKRMNPKELRLGRYPFKAGIKYYEAKRHAKFSPSTMNENVRKLYLFADVFEEMKEKKIVRTTDPRAIDIYDVEGFLEYLKERKLEMSTKIKYTNILDSYLTTFGNNTIHEMKRTSDWPLTRDDDREIFSLERDQVQAIFDAVDDYQSETIMGDWHKIVMSGVLSIMFGTAIRPKEIFQAKVKDLSLEKGNCRFFVEHPKGEDSWGRREWIPIIRGDMIERIETFLEEREVFIKAHGFHESQYLFVNFSTGLPYSGNSIRRIKSEIEKMSGVNFKLKDFRSTYVSLTAEDDMSRLKNISIQLRHKNLKTTEEYYLRVRRDKAQKKIADVWEETAIINSRHRSKDVDEKEDVS